MYDMCINRAKGTSLHTMEVIKAEIVYMHNAQPAQGGEAKRGECIYMYKRVIRAAEYVYCINCISGSMRGGLVGVRLE